MRGLVCCQGSTEVDRRGGFDLDSPPVPARTLASIGEGQSVGRTAPRSGDKCEGGQSVSVTPLPELLAIWYAEHISHLEAGLGVPVALVENHPDRDYGFLPGPPARHVLRAELADAQTLNAYRNCAAGLPSGHESAGWSVCVHRWTVEGTFLQATAHTDSDGPEDLAAIAREAAAQAAQRKA